MGGKLSHSKGHFSPDCTIRGLSNGGARQFLAFDNPIDRVGQFQFCLPLCGARLSNDERSRRAERTLSCSIGRALHHKMFPCALGAAADLPGNSSEIMAQDRGDGSAV